MIESDPYAEEDIGRLLGLLPPAPEGWVRAAQEIPAFRAMLDDLVARAQADEVFQATLIADLESAIAQAGYEPEPRAIEAVRRQMRARDGIDS